MVFETHANQAIVGQVSPARYHRPIELRATMHDNFDTWARMSVSHGWINWPFDSTTCRPQKAGFVVHQQQFSISTSGHGHMQDITGTVADIVGASGIQSGIVQVFNIGSTGAVGTIEFEPGLQRDLPEILDRLMPPDRNYGHEQAWGDGNGHSHLQATTLGPSISIPVSDSALVLGTWQQVFHLECDVRPRQREIMVTIVGQ